MISRNSNSLAASSRSQSQTWRWTSGNDSRRRSGRGGKSPPRSSRAGSSLPLLPLAPDQDAIRQHHTHRMPVEASPQPALILVPAQEPLGLLVILLHPVPPVRVLHHPLQRHRRPKVAPGVPPLAVGAILPDQPARPTPTRRRHPPTAGRNEAPAHPAPAPLPPGHRTPRPRRLRRDQVIGPAHGLAASGQPHGEIAPDGDHVTLAALLQAIQEVGIVALVGVGNHTGPAHA